MTKLVSILERQSHALNCGSSPNLRLFDVGCILPQPKIRHSSRQNACQQATRCSDNVCSHNFAKAFNYFSNWGYLCTRERWWWDHDNSRESSLWQYRTRSNESMYYIFCKLWASELDTQLSKANKLDEGSWNDWTITVHNSLPSIICIAEFLSYSLRILVVCCEHFICILHIQGENVWQYPSIFFRWIPLAQKRVISRHLKLLSRPVSKSDFSVTILYTIVTGIEPSIK